LSDKRLFIQVQRASCAKCIVLPGQGGLPPELKDFQWLLNLACHTDLTAKLNESKGSIFFNIMPFSLLNVS
jgi:hypothetical protein